MIWDSLVGGIDGLISPCLELVGFDDGSFSLGSVNITGLNEGGVVWDSLVGRVDSFVTPGLKLVSFDDSSFTLGAIWSAGLEKS